MVAVMLVTHEAAQAYEAERSRTAYATNVSPTSVSGPASLMIMPNRVGKLRWLSPTDTLSITAIEQAMTGATNNASDNVRSGAASPFERSSIWGQPKGKTNFATRLRKMTEVETSAKAMADDQQ